LPLALTSAVILRSDSRGTRDHILLSEIRDSPTQRARSPIIPSGIGFTFRRHLPLAGIRWRYSTPRQTGWAEGTAH
jgi:hypothetical protein